MRLIIEHLIFLVKFTLFTPRLGQQEELLKEGESSRTSANNKSAHLMKLEDLFRPPLELIHHGTLVSVSHPV